KLVNAYFAEIPKGTKPIPRPNVTEPPLGGEVKATIEDNIQLPAVIEAYRAPKQGSDEYYAFNMLATILSGGPSSPMNQELVDEKQLALQAMALPFFNEDAGLFINFAIANMGVDPEKLQTAMDSVVLNVKNNLISEKEFQKIQNQVETD